MVVQSQVWVLNKNPVGEPKKEDFKCITEELPDCNDGDFITEAEWFSVDPYQRYTLVTTNINGVIAGSQVARVIESKNPEYPVDCRLVFYPGWRTHTLVTAAQLKNGNVLKMHKIFPEMGDYPLSTALGVLGMPGNTAYFGFLEICKPKPGDVVVVNCAAGAVGSAVCQIAKIKGCRVIAFAGTDAKLAWLKELGVDVVANYKTESVTEVLKKEAPKGINCYFDNVGGAFTSEVLPHMALFGRVSICGAISTYNDETKGVGVPTMTSPFSEATMLWKQLRVEGFLVSRWQALFNKGVQQLRVWMDEGKLKYKETVTEGFNNMPSAFIGLFHGDNIGKAVVKMT